MTISDATELLSSDHRKYCTAELKNLLSMRLPKKKEKKSSDDIKIPKDSAVLVPICQLADGSVGLLYTKRSPLLRYSIVTLITATFWLLALPGLFRLWGHFRVGPH